MVMGESAMRNDAGIATSVERVYQSYNPYMQHHHLHHSPSHYGHFPHTYAHDYGHSSGLGSSSYYHPIGSPLPQPLSHPLYGKPVHHDGSDPKQFGLKYSGYEPNYRWVADFFMHLRVFAIPAFPLAVGRITATPTHMESTREKVERLQHCQRSLYSLSSFSLICCRAV